MTISNRLFWCAALSLLFCLPVGAQFTETNIAFAKRETINPFYPDDTTTYFKVAGRITSPNFGTVSNTEFFIQDTNDNVGICVRNLKFAFESNNLPIGCGVTALGYITQSNGLRIIVPEFAADITVTDPTLLPPAAILSTITNLLLAAETNEARFVTITNVTMAGTNWPALNASLTVTNNDGTASIQMRLVGNTDVSGQLPPTNAFDIKAIFSQFDTSAGASGGYQLQPRSYADIIQKVGQEQPQISARTNITAIVNAQMNATVVVQDRNAGDVLTLTTPQAPAAATLAQIASRVHTFTWTPGTPDLGTTNVVFQVTDGSLTGNLTMVVNVRSASGGVGHPWINEFHYDNVSVDTNEGVELAGQTGIDCTNYYLLFYDSGTGNSYYSNACTGVIDDEGHGYGAVWQPVPGSTIQNGPADGIALVHKTLGLMQFISYEGVMTANNGAAAGITSVDCGVSEDGTEPVGLSLQLQGNGTNYEAFTWAGPMTNTYDQLNGAGQIVVGPVNGAVTITNLTLSPAKPAPGAAFDIECLVSPNYSASNLVSTAWYRINAGTWNSIAMSVLAGITNRTTSQVPAQTNGTPIEYYVVTAFDGPGGSSGSSVTATNSYTIASYPPIIAPLTNKSVQVSNLVSFAVSATEPDGDLITLTASNVPGTANFYATNGTGAAAGSFVWTAPYPAGVYTTLFYAVDKDGATWTSVTITVVAPLASNAYVETFDTTGNWTNNAGAMTSYNIKFYTNNALPPSGDWFTGSNAIRETQYTYGGTGSAWRIGSDTTPNVYWRYICPTGVQDFSLWIANWGTNSTLTNWWIRTSTNSGVSYTTLLGTNGSWWAGMTNKTYKQFVSGPLNIVPAPGNMIYIEIGRFQGERILIDQLELTFGGSGGGGTQDGIPVAWWERYGLGPTNTAANDNDGDTRSNWEEYIADSDPTSASSFFPSETTNISGRGTMIIYAGPPTTNSRVYDAWWNTNLVTGSWTPYNFNVPGNNDGSAVALTVTNDAGFRFYQTGVKMLP